MGDTDGLGSFEIAAQLTMLNVLHCKMSGYNRKFGYFLIVGLCTRPKVNYRLYSSNPFFLMQSICGVGPKRSDMFAQTYQ